MLQLGHRLLAGGGRRHPHRPVAQPRAGLAVAAHRQRLRRRHLRPAALAAAHVPRRDRRRPHRGLPRRLPPRGQPVPGQPAARGRGRSSCSSSCWWCPTRGCAPGASCGSSSPRRRRRALFLLGGFVIAGGFVLITTLSATRPDHLRPDLLARHRGPLARPARRLRRADLARAAQLRRHRGDRRGPPRVRRQPARPRPRRPRRRRSSAALVALPGAAALGHLPGAGHRGLRAWPSTGGSSTCPTSTSARSHISLFELGSTEVAADEAVRLHVRHARSSKLMLAAVVFALVAVLVGRRSAGAASAGGCSRSATARRPAPPSA